MALHVLEREHSVAAEAGRRWQRIGSRRRRDLLAVRRAWRTMTIVRVTLSVVVLLAVLTAPASLGAQPETSDAVPAVEFYGPEPELRAYVALALRHSPATQEAFSRYRAVLQRIPQVTALPNPTFSFGQALRSLETRVGPQLNSYTLSQTFPWFGTLGLREQVAVTEAAAAYQHYRAAERELVAEVKRAYYDLAYVDAALGIAEEEQSLLTHYAALAETRYRTGQDLQQSVIKLQVEVTRVIDRRYILRQQRDTLVARLNTLAARPPQTPVSRVDWPARPPVTLDLEDLYALGREHRQELRAASSLVERNDRAIALAQKAYWPDVTIGATYTNLGDREDPIGRLQPPPDNGKNALTLSLGISIPLRKGKYDAGVRQAVEESLAERQRYLSLLNEVEFAVRDQVVRLQTLGEQIRLFETVLIPQAEQALRSTEAAYQTTRVGVLDLLDSERMLLDVRLIKARYDADFLVALARLERAIGTRFPRE